MAQSEKRVCISALDAPRLVITLCDVNASDNLMGCRVSAARRPLPAPRLYLRCVESSYESVT